MTRPLENSEIWTWRRKSQHIFRCRKLQVSPACRFPWQLHLIIGLYDGLSFQENCVAVRIFLGEAKSWALTCLIPPPTAQCFASILCKFASTSPCIRISAVVCTNTTPDCRCTQTLPRSKQIPKWIMMGRCGSRSRRKSASSTQHEKLFMFLSSGLRKVLRGCMQGTTMQRTGK